MGTFSKNLFLKMSTHCGTTLCYVFGHEGRYKVAPVLMKLKSREDSVKSTKPPKNEETGV